MGPKYVEHQHFRVSWCSACRGTYPWLSLWRCGRVSGTHGGRNCRGMEAEVTSVDACHRSHVGLVRSATQPHSPMPVLGTRSGDRQSGRVSVGSRVRERGMVVDDHARMGIMRTVVDGRRREHRVRSVRPTECSTESSDVPHLSRQSGCSAVDDTAHRDRHRPRRAFGITDRRGRQRSCESRCACPRGIRNPAYGGRRDRRSACECLDEVFGRHMHDRRRFPREGRVRSSGTPSPLPTAAARVGSRSRVERGRGISPRTAADRGEPVDARHRAEGHRQRVLVEHNGVRSSSPAIAGAASRTQPRSAAANSSARSSAKVKVPVG